MQANNVSPIKGQQVPLAPAKAIKPAKEPPAAPTLIGAMKDKVVVNLTYLSGHTLQALGYLVPKEAPRTAEVGHAVGKGVELLGETLEAATGFIFQDVVAHGVLGVAKDIAVVATEENLQEAARNQEKVAKGLSFGLGFIPLAGNLLSKTFDAAAAVAQKNIQLQQAKVNIASSLAESCLRKIEQYTGPIGKGIQSVVRGAITNSGRAMQAFFTETLSKSGLLRNYLIEQGDLLVGQAWRREQRNSGDFFSGIASNIVIAAEAKEIDKLPKVEPQLTLEAFRKLTKQEQETILFYIHDAGRLGIRQRSKIAQRRAVRNFAENLKSTQYDKKFEEIVNQYNMLTQGEVNKLTPMRFQGFSVGEKLRILSLLQTVARDANTRHLLLEYKKELLAFQKNPALLEDPVRRRIFEQIQKQAPNSIIKRFNELPLERQAQMLNISSTEFASMKIEQENMVITDLLGKFPKPQQGKPNVDRERLEDILAKNKETRTAADYKTLAKYFRECLGASEKAGVLRQIQNVPALRMVSKAELQDMVTKLQHATEQAIHDDPHSGQTQELVESLVYLQALQQVAEPQEFQRIGAEAPVTISTKEVEKKLKPSEPSHKVATAVDLLGTGVEGLASGVGGFFSLPFKGVGWLASPELIDYSMRGAAWWLENQEILDTFFGVASMIPGFTTRVSQATSALSETGEQFVGTSAPWLQAAGKKIGAWTPQTISTVTDWGAQKVQQISRFTLDTVFSSEQFVVNCFSSLADLEKMSWQRFVDPVLKGSASMVSVGSQYDAPIENFISQYGQEFSKILEAHPNSPIGKFVKITGKNRVITTLKFDDIFKQVQAENSSLNTASKEFLQKLFAAADSKLSEFTHATGMTLHACGFEHCKVDASSITPVISEVCQKIPFLEASNVGLDRLNAHIASQAADEVLKILETTSLERVLPSPATVELIRQTHEEMEKGVEMTKTTLHAYLQGSKVSLDVVKKQMEIFADHTGTKGKLEKFGFLGRTALWAGGGLLDYYQGRVVWRVARRLGVSVLRRTAPLTAKYTRPFWYGLAQGAKGVFSTTGSAAHYLLSSVGVGLQAATNLAYKKAGVVDRESVLAYKRLSDEEQAHITYLVKQSKNWKNFEASYNKAKDLNAKIKQILFALDVMTPEEKTKLSPALFLTFDTATQKKIIALIRESSEVALEANQERDPEIITKKFNEILERERVGLESISTEEFYSLSETEQDDLLYKVIFSEKYRREKLKGVKPQEARVRQLDTYVKIVKEGASPETLRALLVYVAHLSREEKEMLTAAKLAEMGHEKYLQMVQMLGERGKGETEQEARWELDREKMLTLAKHHHDNSAIVNWQKGEYALTAMLYNTQLEPFQRDFIANFTAEELRQVPRFEQIRVLDTILENTPPQQLSKKEREHFIELRKEIVAGETLSSKTIKGIVSRFNILDITVQSSYRQDAEARRLIQKEITLEIEDEQGKARSRIGRARRRMHEASRGYNETMQALLEYEGRVLIQVENEKLQKLKAAGDDYARAIEQNNNEIKTQEEFLAKLDTTLKEVKSGMGIGELLPKQGLQLPPPPQQESEADIINEVVRVSIQPWIKSTNYEAMQTERANFSAQKDEIQKLPKEQLEQKQFRLKVLGAMIDFLDKRMKELRPPAK